MKRHLYKEIIFIPALATLILTTAVDAFSQNAPIGRKLLTTHSEHFTYIFQENLSNNIPELVKTCEDAALLLCPVFKWEPRQRVYVIYNDASDFHNAYATIYPFNLINIYAVKEKRPDTLEDTMRCTFFHEYTHILSTDAQYGFDSTLNGIFGRVVPLADPVSTLLAACAAPPGMLAPRWYLEGLAMWSETEFAGPGRGRSPLVDMYIRMAAHDHDLLGPCRWSIYEPDWPYGNSAYIYGMKAIAYAQAMSNDKTNNVPGALSDSVSHSFLFFFDKHAVPVSGMTFAEIAKRSLAEERKTQSAAIDKLNSTPPTQVSRLTPEKSVAYSPRFIKDGKHVVFACKPPDTRETLCELDIETGTIKPFNDARTQAAFTCIAGTHTSDSIFYNRLNVQNRDEFRYELHMLDPESGEQKRIAARGRYRCFAVSPDETRMLVVSDIDGVEKLAVVSMNDIDSPETAETLETASGNNRICDPAWSPDGSHAAYIHADLRNCELRLLDLASGKKRTLLKWNCIIASPVFDPVKPEILFVSDHSGVYNLYRMPLAKGATPSALTHVIGGVFSPDISPDGKLIAAQCYDSHGYFVSVFETDKLIARPPDSLPSVHPAWPSNPANAKAAAEIAKNPAGEYAHTTQRPYHSLPNIRMNYWTPWLMGDTDTVQGGLAAAFSDPTGFQSLNIMAGIDGEYGCPIGLLDYSYSGFYPILGLFGFYRPETYPRLVEDKKHNFYDFDEKLSTIGGSITLPFVKIDRKVDLTLGYKYTHHEPRHAIPEDTSNLLTDNLFEGGEGAVFFTATFLNATAFESSCSLENGRLLSGTVEKSDKSLGGDLSRTRLLGSWNEYITMPWKQNHVLRLQAVGGTGSGDETAQGFFGLGGFGTPVIAPESGIESSIPLRGYKSNTEVGDNLLKAGVSYRFPLSRYYRGSSATKPLYYHQLFADIYYEGGRATGGADSHEHNWLNSAGIELNLSTTLFRYLELSPGLGYVYAFDRDYADDDDSKSVYYLSIKGIVTF